MEEKKQVVAPVEVSAPKSEQDEKKRVVVPELVGAPKSVLAAMSRVLKLEDLDAMPTCADFRDESVRAEVDASIDANRDIIISSAKMTTTSWYDFAAGEPRFKLLWHGRGLDGRVMLLVIDDAFPTIHVRCADGVAPDKFAEQVEAEMKTIKNGSPAAASCIVYKKKLVFFELNARPYVRVAFGSYKAFEEGMRVFESKGWTMGDIDYRRDRFYLQAVRAAENLNPAGMNTFSYKSRGNPNPRRIVAGLDEVFVVSMAAIHPFEPPAGEMREAYVRPRLTKVCFDIETGSAVRGGAALRPELDYTHSHVLCFTMRYGRRDLLRVALTTSPYARPRPGFLLMYAASEIEMFMMFAHWMRRLRPAIITTYNGDDFDWRFIATKVAKEDLAAEFWGAFDFLVEDFGWIHGTNADRTAKITSHYMRRGYVKISAEEPKCPIYYPDMVSFLNEDIYTRCRIKWPAGKYSPKSLNAFLEKVGEPLKYDMPVERQFDIYEDELKITAANSTESGANSAVVLHCGNGEMVAPTAAEKWRELVERHENNISDVVVYCVFDTISTHDLDDKAGITDEVMVCAAQYVCTPHEAMYLAKGGLVMEKFATSAFRAGYIDCNQRPGRKANYPGGLVLHPRVGLVSVSPNIGEMRRMAAAGSKDVKREWALISDAEEDAMKAAFGEMARLAAGVAPSEMKMALPPMAPVELGPVARGLFELMVGMPLNVPCVNVDFKSMYPSIMTEHNTSTERLVESPEEKAAIVAAGYALYDVVRDIDGVAVRTMFVQRRDGEPGSVGLIPNELQVYGALRREYQAKRDELRTRLKGMKRADDERMYDSLAGQESLFEMKQLECKVAANTMYGKLGDRNNKFYRLEMSSDVTLSGRAYLQKIVDWFLEMGWREWYGDTDSVYADAPSYMFNDIHWSWLAGMFDRLEYARRMVVRALELGKKMTAELNRRLAAEGARFMKVELEGAHFPYLFIRQKRNATGFHEAGPKFGPDGMPGKLHLTGVAEKKGKSSSRLFTLLSSGVLHSLLNVFNVRSAHDIATATVEDAYAKARKGDWPMTTFVRRATFKPEKDNKGIKHFFERLKAEKRATPRAYEKFQWVYVMRDDIEFNEYGNKTKGVGGHSYMELYEYALEKGLTINFTKYMEGEICRELGQYMCADPEFVVRAADASAESRRAAEDATSQAGADFIESLCKRASGCLATSIKKPVYVGIRKCVDRHVQRAMGIAPFQAKALTAIAAEKSVFEMYQARMEAGAREQARPILEQLKKAYWVGACPRPSAQMRPAPETDIARLFKMVMDPESSPRAIFLKAHGNRREQMLTKLHQECEKAQRAAHAHEEAMRAATDAIRANLGLNKHVIEAADIEAAERKLAKGEVALNAPLLNSAALVVGGKVDAGAIAECDKLVEALIEIERNVVAYDQFARLVSDRLNESRGGGLEMQAHDVAEIVGGAEAEIVMPAGVFELDSEPA